MALLLGHGDCVWMDPSQIGIYGGIDSDALDIQCNSVLLPSFVGGWGTFFVRRSPQGGSFVATRPLTHLNL